MIPGQLQPKKKKNRRISAAWAKCLQDPISTEKKLDVVAHTCHSSDDRKYKIGGVRASPPCAKTIK
jgi:hypothetical protein